MAGDYLSAWGTGFGATNPPAPGTGKAAGLSPLYYTVGSTTMTLDRVPCPVLFSGLAPTFVGLYQVNFQVPTIGTGNFRLVLSINGIAANSVWLTTRTRPSQ
jgi:uncharacterized protein (TIGR03437 family)